MAGATDFVPEWNRWLQLVDMSVDFRIQLVTVMTLDYAGAWLAEITLNYLFADNLPKPVITRGTERREARRAVEAAALEAALEEKKDL